jgi:class 3 adenylate cyclase
MTSTRRLAGILAADVAGYSRLMGGDEEGTHERLRAHLQDLINPKIEEHRGRIVKNTGDGMLAEFASVVDAVRCAVIDRLLERRLGARVVFDVGFAQMPQSALICGPGIAALEICIRLDPRDPNLANRLTHVAAGLYYSYEYEATIEAAKRAIRSHPKHPMAYRWLAAALGQTGRTAEAKKALKKAIVIAPASFDMYVRGRAPWMRPENHAHMLEGLRKAGWREE